MQGIFITLQGTAPFKEMYAQGQMELLQIALSTRQPPKQNMGGEKPNYKINLTEEKKFNERF